jgi:pSer/pThr/pTyr-binding forkhead associated (FHA) protein
MWKLVIEDDEGKRTVVPLTRDDYSIGRQEGNTIRLTERNVSRQHGRVRRNRTANGSGNAFFLEDLRSYNGVFVNGLRVAHQQDLQNGDLIQIGDYRIVLQDDAAQAQVENPTVPISNIDPSDAKATIPIATAYRGQTLTERPNRLVMLVGPTPGVEYPLDRERMTIGRAEDASISVNHNSVSRLHCEVHALGDGRFEIVDKGSSNGVRVNAVELRRSIIEAGDVIELGDVRFKFVGAGQVFVPGPNESQQLTAISDREVDLVVSQKKSGIGAYAVPVIGALVVGGGVLIGALLYSHRTGSDAVDASPVVTSEVDQQLLAAAKAKCTPDECEQAHIEIVNIPESSPLRESPDFKWIVSTWASSVMKKAAADPNPESKRLNLQRILADAKVSQAQKDQADAMLKQLDAPVPVPTPTTTELTSPTTSAVAVAPSAKPTHAPAPAPVPKPDAAPAPAPAPKPATNNTEAARAALLKGDTAAVKRLLGPSVNGGHATQDEVTMLKAACKASGDRACVDDIKAKYPSW